MVVGGLRSQFEEFVQREQKQFAFDGTWELVEQLKSVVLINGAKRLGQVYNNISEGDLIAKLGISKSDGFDLIGFMGQHKDLIGEFMVNMEKKVICFEKKQLKEHDDSLRLGMMKRIKHLNSLQEHLIKNMSFTQEEKTQEKNKENEESLLDAFDEFSDLDLG